MNKDEIDKISKEIDRHKMFVSSNEDWEINGIPKKIRNCEEESVEIEKNIKKLERIATDNDDWELHNMVKKMKRNL